MATSPPTRARLQVLPYSAWIVKQIQTLISCPSIWRQCRMLSELAPYLWCDTFSYRLKESEHTSKAMLLRLWSTLLQLVDQVPAHQRGLCYAAIIKLAHRYEFDLIHTHDPAKINVALDLQLQHQYYDQLVQTQLYVFDKLQQRSAPIPKVLLHFCVQITALSFFRLPTISQSIVEQACSGTSSVAPISAVQSPAQSPPTPLIAPPASPPMAPLEPLAPISFLPISLNLTDRGGLPYSDAARTAMLRQSSTATPVKISIEPAQPTNGQSASIFRSTSAPNLASLASLPLCRPAIRRRYSQSPSYDPQTLGAPLALPAAAHTSVDEPLPRITSHSISLCSMASSPPLSAVITRSPAPTPAPRPLSATPSAANLLQLGLGTTTTSNSHRHSHVGSSADLSKLAVASDHDLLERSGANGSADQNSANGYFGQHIWSLLLTAPMPRVSINSTEDDHTSPPSNPTPSTLLPATHSLQGSQRLVIPLKGSSIRSSDSGLSPTKHNYRALPTSVSFEPDLVVEEEYDQPQLSPVKLESSQSDDEVIVEPTNGELWWQNLIRISLHAVQERQEHADSAAVSTSHWFRLHNPSFFEWHQVRAAALSNKELNIVEMNAREARLQEVAVDGLSILSSSDVFFTFASALFHHCIQSAHGPCRNSLLPGYWRMACATIDKLMDAMIALAAHTVTETHHINRLALVLDSCADDDSSNYLKDVTASIRSDSLCLASPTTAAPTSNDIEGQTEANVAEPQAPEQPASNQQIAEETHSVEQSTLWDDISKATCALATNEDMVPLLIASVFHATSMHDKRTINQSFDLVDSWLHVLSQDPAATLSPAIAGCVFAFIERATMRLLASSHFQVLLKCLCFVYTHVGRLPNALRLRLLKDVLFDRYFYALFLHWCPEVRRQFHHILVYRLNRSGPAQSAAHLEIHTQSSADESIRTDSTLQQTTDSAPRTSIFSRVTSMVSNLIRTAAGAVLENNTAHSASTSNNPSKVNRVRSAMETCCLEPGDPVPSSCVLVSCAMSDEDCAVDTLLMSRLNVYIHMVEEQVRNPSLCYFPASAFVYARASIRELEKYHRVQHAAAGTGNALRVGQVLMPVLSFQIIQNDE